MVKIAQSPFSFTIFFGEVDALQDEEIPQSDQDEGDTIVEEEEAPSHSQDADMGMIVIPLRFRSDFF